MSLPDAEPWARGFFVSFDRTTDALHEVDAYFKRSGRVIIPLTVREILDEQIARKLKGASGRVRKPRSLTVEEFQKLVAVLHLPFNTMALLAVCFGLRVSELLALRWGDVDWVAGTVTIERRIVAQQVDDVKTAGSRKTMPADRELLEALKRWKQTTQFSGEADWIFASPVQLGRLPHLRQRVLARTAACGE